MNKSYKDDLGRKTWAFLHTLAEGYPDRPSENEKSGMNSLFYSIAKMYPCSICRNHYKQMIINHPPKVSNGKELRLYLCNLHNIVNKRLNKPIYKCN